MSRVDKIIQTLDIEKNCLGIYSQNKFYFKNQTEALQNSNMAWRHSKILGDDKDWLFINLLLRDQDLLKYSTNPILMKSISNALEAQKKAALTAKIDFSK